MIRVLLILLAAAFTLLASWAAGRLLIARLRLRLYRWEANLLAFLAGSAILATIVCLFACAHLVHRGVLAALGLGLLLAAWRAGALRPAADGLPPLSTTWRVVFWLPFLLYAGLYLTVALAPECSPDGLIYHVTLPARILRDHGFDFAAQDLFTNMPQGVEMLFLFAFPLGRHSSAAVVHLLFTLAAPLAMLGWARRAGMPAAGVAGALLFFLSPITGKDGSTAYVDVAAAAAVFGCFYALEIWRDTRQSGLLAIAGLLAGFAFAAKYNAGLAVPYALAYAAISLRKDRRALPRALFLIALSAAVVILPWLLKNVYVTGNPLSPVANGLFPNPALSVHIERFTAETMRTMNGTRPGWLQFPFELTLRGALLQGLLGPVFLLAPLALVALWRPAGRRLLLAAALFAALYPASVATRFLLPALPFLALALGVALSLWRPAAVAAVATVVAHAVLSWPAVVALYAQPYAWRIEEIPWRAALRLQPESEYLDERIGAGRIWQLLDRVVPRGQTVLSFNSFPQSYCNTRVIAGWQSSFTFRLNEALDTPYTGYLWPVWYHRFSFPETRLRRLRLVQTASSPEDRWSVSELRFFRAGAELPRSPQWRLRAQPNPWEVQFAFDNNPVTRWTSGQPHRPGMFLEIDFGAETALDGVLAELTLDETAARLRLDVEQGPGRWSPLPAAPDVYQNQPPPSQLRRAATDFLRSSGVSWILVEDSAANAADFLARREEWNISLIGHLDNRRLYRVGDAPR